MKTQTALNANSSIILQVSFVPLMKNARNKSKRWRIFDENKSNCNMQSTDYKQDSSEESDNNIKEKIKMKNKIKHKCVCISHANTHAHTRGLFSDILHQSLRNFYLAHIKGAVYMMFMD